MPATGTLIWVGIFGAAGAIARFLADGFVAKIWSDPFPVGTFLINGLGCFLAGFLAATAAGRTAWLSGDARIGVTVGFLGGFTTFSAYALQSLQAAQAGQFNVALTYFLMSPVLGLVCAWGGYWAAR